MTNRKRTVPVVASSLASVLCIGALAVPMSTYTPQAYADTYSDLVNAQNSHAQSKQREAALREQLAGVNSDLADKIVELDDLNNNKIPAAQSAATQAQQEKSSLDKLRAAGESTRADLENQKSSLTTQAAQQAAQTVMLQSEIDAKNQQWAAEQAAAAAQVQEPEPQGTVEAPAAAAPQPSVPQQTQTPSQPAQTQRPSTPSQPSTPPTPVVTRPSTGGQGTSNGDYGNAYAAGQCTWWAYERRKQMGIGTPSYLGNGGQWWSTAPSYGLRVDHSPQVGAALSFLPGQEGASSPWGHVAVVEQVNGNSILISESNVAGLYTITYRTLYNPGRFWYVH